MENLLFITFPLSSFIHIFTLIDFSSFERAASLLKRLKVGNHSNLFSLPSFAMNFSQTFSFPSTVEGETKKIRRWSWQQKSEREYKAFSMFEMDTKVKLYIVRVICDYDVIYCLQRSLLLCCVYAGVFCKFLVNSKQTKGKCFFGFKLSCRWFSA